MLVVLGTLAIAVVGTIALVKLPIDAVPDITNNQVQINTAYAALSPEEVEKQITFPVETALAGIPGLQYTRSLSRNGFSQVTAVFDDNVDIYFARAQVTERIGAAKKSLPPGAEPVMGAISTGLGEIYMYTVEYEHADRKGTTLKDGSPGWQSDGTYITPEGELLTTDLSRSAYLRTVQDWLIRPQLKGISGVAGVDAIGGYVKEYHVQPDPHKLVAYGLTFSDVIEAIERNNSSTGAGYIEHKGEAYLVRAAGRITTVEQLANIVIGSRDGTPIHIHDVAEVGIGKELRTGSASENGEEVVVGTALMLIGANSRTVSEAVDEKLAQINKGLPSGIRAKTVLNRTKLVNATIETVQKNLIEGAVLVITVLFVMLGNLKAAGITALAIPLSMLITAIGMVQTTISGNLMSLGAVDFGLIVDGAVIIVENCLRHLAKKQHQLGRMLNVRERLQEISSAAKEMIQPSVYGQAIIITVYIPILALTGVEGKMFHPMAITVIFALVGAFALSLTFVPAMMALLITGKVSERDNFIIAEAKRRYAPLVEMALNFRFLVVSVAVVLFLVSLSLFNSLGQEFVPTLDEKDIAMHAMRIPSTGLTQSSEMQYKVERAVAKLPEVEFVFSKTGTAEMAADPMPPNVSDTFIILRSKNEWPNPSKTKDELISEIEKAVSQVPGNNYEFTQPIQMRFNELISGVRSDVAVKVYGEEFSQMQTIAQQIASILRGIQGAADIKVEQTEGLPVMNIDIDRDTIFRLGLNVKDVQNVISIAVGGREAGLVFQGDKRFDIKVRLDEKVRADLKSIDSLPVPVPVEALEGSLNRKPERLSLEQNNQGRFVPLGALARIEVSEGPNQISRENGKRRIVVQANVRGRDLGSFVKEAQHKLESIQPAPGGWFEWGGQFENLQAASRRLTLVVPVCFFLIFLLLFSSFNSVKYALLVFSGVPLGMTGGIVALWLRSMPFSISAAVGFIALSGVAVLNGLVMVSFINTLRKEGKNVHDAIVEGALTRLRPVLMTALVASLGFVPMALATGTGSEVQRPIATVVIGGLVSATVLTLLVIPAIYSLFNREEDSKSAQSEFESAQCRPS